MKETDDFYELLFETAETGKNYVTKMFPRIYKFVIRDLVE